jgi:integrase
MKARLTQRSIEAAKKGFLWDTDLIGFGLKTTGNGRKVFIVQKRPHKGAKTLKRWSLGEYPVLSPEEARTQAKTLLATLTLGGPLPAATGQPRVSFRDKIEEFYQDHVLLKLKPTTQKDMRYMIDKYLIPSFGQLTLAEVTHNQVRSFHTRLGSKHPYRANRVLALFSKFFSWLAPDTVNPCKGIEKFREKRREPKIADHSLQSLLDSSVHPVIRLLLLTGMRKNEVLSLRWECISLPESLIRLSDSKTGERTIYLGAPARELLRSLQPDTPAGWVFPQQRQRRAGVDGSGHLVGLQKIWKKTLRDLGVDTSLRIHDLRHHYASQAAKGNTLALVAGLLGHRDIKTTMRYVHSAREDLRAASELVVEKLLNHR